MKEMLDKKLEETDWYHPYTAGRDQSKCAAPLLLHCTAHWRTT
jgi:hypothetical protein